MITKKIIYLYFIFLLCDLTISQETECHIPSDVIKEQKTGQKAWDKCIDLINITYPCVSDENGLKNRVNKCPIRTSLILEYDTTNEFPHMAQLGYVEVSNNVTKTIWDCGGILISERWVLTAAHCIYNLDADSDAKYVKLKNSNESKYVYQIAETILHPNFTYFKVYDNIALLKLDRDVDFSTSVSPACLHVGNLLNDSIVQTSWIENGDRTELFKENMRIIEYEECSNAFKKSRKSANGVKDETQFCADNLYAVTDKRLESSGGVIQVYNKNMHCSYTVLGIPIYFRLRGPNLYTRISPYISWIESHVWP